MIKAPTSVSRFPGAARPARWRLAAALLAVLAALAPAPARAAEKPAAKDKGAAADKPGDKSADKAGKARKVTPAEKFLREAEGKLDNFTFGPADLAAAERHAKQAKTPAGRLPFDLLIARYQREYQNRPDRAAAAVLPHLFPKEAAAAWEKETAKLRHAAPKAAPAKDGKAKTGAKEAQGGEGEGAANAAAAPLAPLPPAGDWNLTSDNAPAAVEAAACLAAAGQMAEALSVINRVGAGFADANRVRAAETAGDLNFDAASYARAVEFYDYGIKYLNAALGTENAEKRTADGGYAKEYSEYEQALRARLARKRDAAQRRLEADRYGDDWALYRDATRAEWERHDPAAAWLLYQQLIKEYPDTVYAEAARCYGVKCLLALSVAGARPAKRAPGKKAAAGTPPPPTPAEALAATLRAREQAAARAEKLLTAAAKAKVAKSVLAKLKDGLERRKQAIEELKSVPTGDKALKRAEKDAAEFLAANRLGLYRGEVLYALGNHALEEEYDAEKADQWFAKAIDWFIEAKTADAELERFSVPGKAAEKATPPPTMHNHDIWGNMHWSFPKPGQLFNRRESNWYADYHRMMASTKRALTRFIMGDKEMAQKLIKVILEVDSAERALAEQGWPNSYGRLRDEFDDDRLFATKEELSHFKGKMKTRLMVADYYYEIEQFDKAHQLYREFDRDCGDQLDNAARAYLDMMLGLACQYEDKMEQAMKYFKAFDDVNGKYAHTPTWQRMQWVLIGYYEENKNGNRNRDYCHEIYRRLIVRCGNTKERWMAQVDYGAFNLAWEDYDKAEPLLQEIIDKCPFKEIVDSAQRSMNEIHIAKNIHK